MRLCKETYQAHMSGQLSGQSPNWNSQMQNLVAASAGACGSVVPSGSIVGPMDHDILKLREYVQILVFNVLQQHQPSTADAASKAKCMEVARRLDEGLFKVANTKEEYVNESTLKSRIASLIKGNGYNQRHTNSSMAGTMVPTTGLSHAGGNPSSMVTPSASASVGLGPLRNTIVPMDHAGLKDREHMRTLVLKELEKRQPCPADDASKAMFLDVARRLEEGLFQMANTREDYMNPSTLNSRLTSLVRGRKVNNTQIQQNANSSPPGTMTTTLAPEVPAETTMVREKVLESEDELETEIAEILKSMNLYH